MSLWSPNRYYPISGNRIFQRMSRSRPNRQRFPNSILLMSRSAWLSCRNIVHQNNPSRTPNSAHFQSVACRKLFSAAVIWSRRITPTHKSGQAGRGRSFSWHFLLSTIGVISTPNFYTYCHNRCKKDRYFFIYQSHNEKTSGKIETF